MRLNPVTTAGRAILALAPAGRHDLPKFLEQLQPAREGDLVLIDLADVGLLTSSYFNAALWPLWEDRRYLVPVLANVSGDFVEEIEVVLRDRGRGVWAVQGHEGDLREPRLLGVLDMPARSALDLLLSLGHATASDLAATDSRVQATAWNNRLASLYEHRLARRTKVGRQLVYSLPWLPEVTHG